MNNLEQLYKDREGYKRLKEACLLCEKDFLDSLNLPESPDIKPSKRHEKRMRKILRMYRDKRSRQSAAKMQKRYSSHPRFVSTVRGKAAVILASIMLLLLTSVTAEALGFPVFKYIETAYEKFIELFVDRSEITEYPTTIEEVYTLTGLPEGFVETECEKDDVSVNTKWENGSAEIKLSQELLSGKVTIDNDYSENEKIIHNGMEVYYKHISNISVVYFHNGRYLFMIYSSSNKTLDDMIILVDSINIKSEQQINKE